MSEFEKMIKGEIYDAYDEELCKKRAKAHDLARIFNNLSEYNTINRNSIIKQLLPNSDETTYIQGPIQVDYGENIYLGKNFYANFNFVVLDVCPVIIGDNVFFGPNCSLYTALHPLEYKDRNCYFNKDKNRMSDKEYGSPITIGNNVWFGGNVTVLPGVKIGNGSVIGAGSVVTHDIPDNVVAVGNPAKVLKKIINK